MKMKRICPVCGKAYTGYPAQSRYDDELYICPDCGVKEALYEWAEANKKGEEK